MLVLLLGLVLCLVALVAMAFGYEAARRAGLRRGELVVEFLRRGGHEHARRATRARALNRILAVARELELAKRAARA